MCAISHDIPHFSPRTSCTRRSFGVLFYEVMTNGAVPYVTLTTNAAVQQRVCTGFTMPCGAEKPLSSERRPLFLLV